MSTACVERKITVAKVVEVLEQVAAEEPHRVDPSAEAGLMPRYLNQGRPNCLVAQVLSRLGFSRAVLRALDREYPVGELVHAGAEIAHSRNPALRRLDPAGRALLQFIQERQGLAWGRVTRDALTPSRWFARPARSRRPWLSC